MIWILWHRRIGDLNQMQDLVQSLGGPFVVKKLQFRKPHYAPLARLADGSDQLSEPWPEIILCAEALTSVIAQRVKKLSVGKIKIISLARPSGDVRNFDLVLATAQYRLPKLPHVVELSLPLTKPTPSKMSQSKSIAVLVGASSPPEVLDVAAAKNMVEALKAKAEQSSAQLKIVTSPRTSAEVARVFLDSIHAPHRVFVWSKDRENPYQKIVCEAHEVVVTSDSVSMLADGLAASKPVSVYRLPRKFSPLQKFVEWFFLHWPRSFIFRSGLIEPATDRWLLIEKLIKAGQVRWFGDADIEHIPFDPQQDLDLAVAAITRLNLPR
jgi:uncharacterized protein